MFSYDHLICFAVCGCDGLLVVGRGRRGKEGAGDGDHRLHEAVYMGQAFGDMGEGFRHSRWTKECFSNYYLS